MTNQAKYSELANIQLLISFFSAGFFISAISWSSLSYLGIDNKQYNNATAFITVYM